MRRFIDESDMEGAARFWLLLGLCYQQSVGIIGGRVLMTKSTLRTSKVRKHTKSARGRPPVHRESWSKVSVVLFDRQIVHLDRLATDIRGRSGKILNRAEIIRA